MKKENSIPITVNSFILSVICFFSSKVHSKVRWILSFSNLHVSRFVLNSCTSLCSVLNSSSNTCTLVVTFSNFSYINLNFNNNIFKYNLILKKNYKILFTCNLKTLLLFSLTVELQSASTANAI